MNENDIDDVFQSIYTAIIAANRNLQEKVQVRLLISPLIIVLVLQSFILSKEAVIKLPKELDHPKRDLTNIQNTVDNECFK